MKYINNTSEWVLNIAPGATVDCPTLPRYEIIVDEEWNKTKKLIECYPNPEAVDTFEEAGLEPYEEPIEE